MQKENARAVGGIVKKQQSRQMRRDCDKCISMYTCTSHSLVLQQHSFLAGLCHPELHHGFRRDLN
jgi:hypothetical protein